MPDPPLLLPLAPAASLFMHSTTSCITALLRFGQRDASCTVRVRCSIFWTTPLTLPQFFVRRALRIIAILALNIRFLHQDIKAWGPGVVFLSSSVRCKMGAMAT